VSAGCNQNLRLLCLPHPLHPLRDHRKSLPAALALVDDLFYGGKRSGTLRFLTDFLQERVHLAKKTNSISFPTPGAINNSSFGAPCSTNAATISPVTRHLSQGYPPRMPPRYSRQRSAARTAWSPSCGLCASRLPGGDHTVEESVEHQYGSPSWAWFLQIIRGLVLKNTNYIPLARISVLPSGQHRWYLQPPPLERFFIPFPSGSRSNAWLITGPAARSSLVLYFQDHALRCADAQSRLWLLTTQDLSKTWAKNPARIGSKPGVEGCKSRRINNKLD
jgi:hypothetical protein